jgi:transcription initiation factor TFIIIB Brf1 subunit/transcription initiation factor TFIIB
VGNARGIVYCSKCGESIPKELIENYLLRYGLKFEDVKEEFSQANKIIDVARTYTVADVSKALAYMHYYRQGKFRKAIEIMREGGLKSRKTFRKVLKMMFGVTVCLDDCMINMFIEKAEECGFSEDMILKGINILRKVSEKRAIFRSMVAAVFYYVSKKRLSQKDVAEIFDVSEVVIRRNIKYLRGIGILEEKT